VKIFSGETIAQPETGLRHTSLHTRVEAPDFRIRLSVLADL
jgi:hypothetical protein